MHIIIPIHPTQLRHIFTVLSSKNNFTWFSNYALHHRQHLKLHKLLSLLFPVILNEAIFMEKNTTTELIVHHSMCQSSMTYNKYHICVEQWRDDVWYPMFQGHVGRCTNTLGSKNCVFVYWSVCVDSEDDMMYASNGMASVYFLAALCYFYPLHDRELLIVQT